VREKISSWARSPASHRTVVFLALVSPVVVQVLLGDMDPAEGVRQIAALALGYLGAGS